jgi:hypothetical protein
MSRRSENLRAGKRLKPERQRLVLDAPTTEFHGSVARALVHVTPQKGAVPAYLFNSAA